MPSSLQSRLNVALLVGALIGLATGLIMMLAGNDELARIAWAAGVIPVFAALLAEIVRSLLRGEVGLDIVAALSMSAALFFGETLAAAAVALMYSGGTFLESLQKAAPVARSASCSRAYHALPPGTPKAGWKMCRSTL